MLVLVKVGFFRYDMETAAPVLTTITSGFPWTSSLAVIGCDNLPSTLSIAKAGSESALCSLNQSLPI